MRTHPIVTLSLILAVLALLGAAYALGMLRLPTRPPCADCGKSTGTNDGKAFISTAHLNGAHDAAHP